MARRPPLLVDPSGRTLVEDDTGDQTARLVKCLLACFGAFKGIATSPTGTITVDDPQKQEQYREYVCQKIVEILGAKTIETHYGIRFAEPHEVDESASGRTH